MRAGAEVVRPGGEGELSRGDSSSSSSSPKMYWCCSIHSCKEGAGLSGRGHHYLTGGQAYCPHQEQCQLLGSGTSIPESACSQLAHRCGAAWGPGCSGPGSAWVQTPVPDWPSPSYSRTRVGTLWTGVRGEAVTTDTSYTTGVVSPVPRPPQQTATEWSLGMWLPSNIVVTAYVRLQYWKVM